MPSFAQQQWKTDSDITTDDDVELRGDEAEEETENVAFAAEREKSIFERKEDFSVVTGLPQLAEEEIGTVSVAHRI